MNVKIKLQQKKTSVVSCNASVVKIYNPTSSLVRFESKTIFFRFEKML
jgi:hypothetical protein